MTKINVVAVNNTRSHSRGFLSGIFNACSYNNRNNTLLNKYMEDPGQQPSGMTTHFKEEALNKGSFRASLRSGFTLIELLVVVLIIGILAAVALPQYQMAVNKSRATQGVVTATAIYVAEQQYFLENGTYTMNLEDLDLSFPSCVKTNTNRYTCDNFKLNFTSFPSIYVDLGPKASIQIERYFSRNRTLCYSSTTSGIQLCKNLGGTPHPRQAYYWLLP